MNALPVRSSLCRLSSFSFAIALVLLLCGGAWVRPAWAASDVSVVVVDAVTGKPVLDPVVTVNGKVLTADANGHFAVGGNEIGVMARAPGYLRTSVGMPDIQHNGGKVSLKPFAVHALYLSEYGVSSASIRDAAVDIIRRGGANALVVNVKSDHGMLIYPSKIPFAQKIGSRNLTLVKSLPDLVNQMHAQGIYMIARIVTFKDDPLTKARPDLAIHKTDGSVFTDREHLGWADSTQKEVRDYDIAIGVEAAQAGFDEVQYDYVRFPDATQKLVLHGPTDEQHRIETITGFLHDAHVALAPYNVFHSADIFGYTAWNTNDTGIGQHLEHIMANVDYACPMLYPSGFQFGIPGHPKPMTTNDDIYATVKLSLDNSIKRSGVNPKKFRPWLQAFRDYAFGHKIFGPSEVAIQIKAANDAHTDGWLLWNPRNRYGDIGLVASAQKADSAKK